MKHDFVGTVAVSKQTGGNINIASQMASTSPSPSFYMLRIHFHHATPAAINVFNTYFYLECRRFSGISNAIYLYLVACCCVGEKNDVAFLASLAQPTLRR